MGFWSQYLGLTVEARTYLWIWHAQLTVEIYRHICILKIYVVSTRQDLGLTNTLNQYGRTKTNTKGNEALAKDTPCRHKEHSYRRHGHFMNKRKTSKLRIHMLATIQATSSPIYSTSSCFLIPQDAYRDHSASRTFLSPSRKPLAASPALVDTDESGDIRLLVKSLR